MKRQRIITHAFMLGSFFALVVNCDAQGTLQFTAALSGANEMPPSNSQFSGGASFSLTGSTVLYSLSTGPMDTPNVPATITGPGLAGPMVYSFTQPPILIQGLQPGTQSGWFWGLASFTLSSPQIAELQAGQLYVNIPTVNFPGGELSGQILPVPEPSSFALLALGSGLLAFSALVPGRRSQSAGLFLPLRVSPVGRFGSFIRILVPSPDSTRATRP
jgi:hypothetical protein